jgi:hypothetical protein
MNWNHTKLIQILFKIQPKCDVLCYAIFVQLANGGFNKGWIKEVEFFHESEQKKKNIE